MRPRESRPDRRGNGHVAALAAILVVGMVWPAAASSFDEAMKVRATANQESKASQARIDELANSTEKLLQQYRQTLSQLDAVRVFNAHMEKLVASQQEEIASLEKQINDIELVGRQVTPLMLKMIDAIDRFVELDVPFLLDERRSRVANLRELMARADVTEAEKYRAVMEAYQIENEFGRTIESYQDTLEIDGEPREVDFLRLGRIVLVYQTPDGALNGAWDHRAKQWVPLDRSYQQAIKQGLRMARKQAAPSLILAPVPAAESK